MDSSSDSLEGLSVSGFGTGVMTNDLTNDSQGTYCELGENSQHLESQDLFGSQTSSLSSVLECSNPNMKRQSENDFSIITTASTPLTKRIKGVTQKEDRRRSSTSGAGEHYQKTRKISTADHSDIVETSDSGSQPQQNNGTIFISSASGDHSQLMGLSQLDTQLKLPNNGSDELNLSQIDTQLKLNNDVEELGEEPQLPASWSSSNALNHTSELHNMSSNSYNSHQIQATKLTERWENKKVVSKTYSVHAVATIKEVRCEATNQILSMQLLEFSCVQPNTNNSSPFVSKSSPSGGGGVGRDSLSSGSVYSMKDGPFPLKGSTHNQRMSNVSSSSELPSSAASLAVRLLHRQLQKDSISHPISCSNCHYEYKSPLPLPPPISTPDLVSSGTDHNSSSVCEDELNKTDNQLNFPPPARAPRQRKHKPVPPLDEEEENETLVSKSDDKDNKKRTSSSSSPSFLLPPPSFLLLPIYSMGLVLCVYECFQSSAIFERDIGIILIWFFIHTDVIL
uniref:Uncharacterized protein n=1 Tax=Cacopsylla melanoneura TaxID=428564 RepID=A0A8D8LW17_9HEMI